MSEDAGPSTRRSTRSRVPATKQPKTVAAERKLPTRASTGSKRKVRDSATDPESQLEFLLTDSKSPLTTMNILDVLNYETFIKLSPESQQRLCALLPPTAFTTYQPRIDPTHPSLQIRAQQERSHGSVVDGNSMAEDQMMVDPQKDATKQSPETMDPSVFSSSFFQSAALTFQDHLYSSWFSRKAKETEERCEQGIRDGSMHAEWKDVEWERDNDVQALSRNTHNTDLTGLATRSLIQEGDVIAYRRTFAANYVTIEKDLLVHAINPLSHAITLLLRPNTAKSLPQQLLVIAPPNPEPPTLTMEGILSSVELENEILETDGRISRSDRYAATQEDVRSRQSTNNHADPFDTAGLVISAKAAKSLSVWRWREEMRDELELQMIQERGGREPLGTVYYLRNS